MSRKKKRAAVARQALHTPGRNDLFNFLARGDPQYWQSANLEERETLAYLTEIVQLAMTRFEWHGLPDTCDARYLELNLLFSGVATIAAPVKLPHVIVSTQADRVGRPNVYDNPTEWESFGRNGWHFKVTPKNGVLVYDNLSRMPIFNQLELLAKRLARFDRTLDINTLHQRVPMWVSGPQQLQADMTESVKQSSGGEPFYLTTESYREVEIKPLYPKVDFIGEELQMAQEKVWAQVYRVLGIDFVSRKTERMVEEEVKSQANPTSLRALHALAARRAAADQVNKLFGTNISVTWREDTLGDNWRIQHDAEALLAATDEGKTLVDAQKEEEGAESGTPTPA